MDAIAPHTAREAAALAAGTALSWIGPIRAIGYEPTVIFMAMLGTGLALFKDPPSGTRQQFYLYAFGVAAVSASVVSLLVDWGTVSAKVGPPAAFLIAYFSKVGMAAIERGITRRVENTIAGNGGTGDDSNGGPLP